VEAQQFKTSYEGIIGNVEKVIKGKNEVVRLSLVAILCEGHILFEDVPGTGKSMLARALSQSIRATANRVQCTPDMLPGDITGSSIYDQKRGVFEFRSGPIFANVLLSDEINRATPKTQSALLEAMAERKVSVDGVTHDLPRPFLVLATQNPIELARIDWLSARASIDLPVPGTSSKRMWPSQRIATRDSRTTSFLPLMTFSTLPMIPS